MNSSQITNPTQLGDALAAEHYLLFKHSHRCPTSDLAFRAYERFSASRPDLVHGWIDVVDDRDLARAAAEETKVQHASPQALWLHRGHVLWHASHFEITEKSLAEQVVPAP